MNKKALKPILITSIALVLIVAAYFAITMIPEPGANDPSPTPTASKAPENYSLYNEDYYALERMDFAFRDGETLSILVDDSQSARIFHLQPAQSGWNYSQEKMRATAFNAISMSALAKVAENVTDFSQYELDNPSLIARAVFEIDNKAVTREIHFGKMTTLQDSYYARLKDDTTVYAVSKYVVQNLMTTELQYRELNFFPSYLSEDQTTIEAAGSITYIRVFNPSNSQDIEITMRTSDELKDMPVGTTLYRMTKPVVSECNDSIIDEKLINVAAALKVTAVVEDEPQDLAKYGLDTPLEIWMRNTDGTEVHYLIGDNNGTAAYVMVEGTNTVLFADSFAPSLRELNYLDYMFKLLWLHNINDVESIVYNMKGDKKLLEIRENVRGDDGKVVSFKAVLDGRPIEESNARRLFSRMLNMMINGDLKEPLDIESKNPDYTFTINMLDGSKNELRLFALNERQFAGSLNGEEATFFINISNIRSLEEAFDYIARGEEIPR